jgi:cell division protein FtsZ
VIDDELGDEVKVTVIAAGFDRWDSGATAARPGAKSTDKPTASLKDLFADQPTDPLDDGDDDFDVPSFLK